MNLKKRKVFVVMACLLAGMCVTAGLYVFGAGGAAGGGLELDQNAVTGVMPGVDREKRQAELQEALDASMIAFSVNTNPVFANGSSEGNLLIENPVQNEKLLVAEIYLDETQELVYRSGAIPPGAYIGAAKLDTKLAAGKYAATIYLKGYALEDESYIGQAGAQLQLHVEN